MSLYADANLLIRLYLDLDAEEVRRHHACGLHA